MATIPFTTLKESEDINVIAAEVRSKYHIEVHPGDRLDIEAKVKTWNRGVGKASVKSWVEGELACEVEVTLVVPSIFEKYRMKKVEK